MQNLSTKQLLSFIHGAVHTYEQNGAWGFRRVTESQLDFWKNESEGLGANAAKTTGVRVEFVTDSDKLAFTVASTGKWEVYADGLLLSRNVVRDGRGKTIDIDLPKGKKHVTILFPGHSDGLIKSVALSDGAGVQPYTFDRKILFIGDSITQGWDSKHDGFSFANNICRMLDADCVNQGIGGSYFAEGSIEKLDGNFDDVIVAYGTNDLGARSALNEIAYHADKALEAVATLYNGARLWAITPIWRADDSKAFKCNASFAEMSEVVSAAAKKHGFTVIDGLKLVPHDTGFYADEYLHPNDLGFAVYSQNLIRHILKG